MAHWMRTQERAGQERHLSPQPFLSHRDEIVGQVRMAARRKREEKEGLKKGKNSGEARGSLFLREKEGSERTSPVDSLLFCQTSDAPAPRGSLKERGKRRRERERGRKGTRDGTTRNETREVFIAAVVKAVRPASVHRRFDTYRVFGNWWYKREESRSHGGGRRDDSGMFLHADSVFRSRARKI